MTKYSVMINKYPVEWHEMDNGEAQFVFTPVEPTRNWIPILKLQNCFDTIEEAEKMIEKHKEYRKSKGWFDRTEEGLIGVLRIEV